MPETYWSMSCSTGAALRARRPRSTFACLAISCSVCVARHERRESGDEGEGLEPRHVDGGDPGVEARLLEQEAAVLGGHPARRRRSPRRVSSR